MDSLEFIKQNCKCCISGKPLIDSENINMVQLNFKALWKYPVWGNLITGPENMAVAYVHDDCVKNGVITGRIKYAVELNEGKIIYHEIKDEMLEINYTM